MVSVIIPTYNAGNYLPSLLKQLREQTIECELIIIDSQSTDDTQDIAKEEKVMLITISKNEFNHGATRNLGVKMASSETVVFLTQDALPESNDTISKLVNLLYSGKDIAMAYGRQLAYSQTGVFGYYARLVNYPNITMIKGKDMISKMGIKTCSCSNSFAAYRKEDLLSVGGFPSDLILGEDVSVAARFILNNKLVAYSAEAKVYHSHDYTIVEEFKRYFDIGVFHYQQSSILSQFSKAETEGFKYMLDELKYLSKNRHLKLVPEQLIRSIAKYSGYKLGKWHKYFPAKLKREFSMHAFFWSKAR